MRQSARNSALPSTHCGRKIRRKAQEHGRESLTQAIGRAVFSNNGEGLLVPSARVPQGVNVVYLPENHCTGSRVAVLESDKLDRLRLQ